MNKLPTIKVIWAHAPISTNEVVSKVLETSTWSSKTIQSLLARLVKKGALEYKKHSRVYVYTPLVKEEEYLEKESTSFLNRFYNGTLNSMVVNFLSQNKKYFG